MRLLNWLTRHKRRQERVTSLIVEVRNRLLDFLKLRSAKFFSFFLFCRIIWILSTKMPKMRKVKFAAVKRMINPKDSRIKKENRDPPKEKKKISDEIVVRQKTKVSSAMYLRYNTQLGPPYHILIDTNFVNFSIKCKLDIIQSMMNCLYAKCIPYITDCVMAELEKLGRRYRLALRIVKDPRFERLSCMHKGTYADDCIVHRIEQHKCYIVATCDKDLRRRIRKIPGVPIMFMSGRRYNIERMPDAFGAPRQ